MRLRRRVSPTPFAHPSLLPHDSLPLTVISSVLRLSFRATSFTSSTLLPCCSRSYSFPRVGNPFARQVPLPTTYHLLRVFPSFSLPPSARHFRRCSPTALPAGFIREAKCARDSYSLQKRARESEREIERRERRKRGKKDDSFS